MLDFKNNIYASKNGIKKYKLDKDRYPIELDEYLVPPGTKVTLINYLNNSITFPIELSGKGYVALIMYEKYGKFYVKEEDLIIVKQ